MAVTWWRLLVAAVVVETGGGGGGSNCEVSPAQVEKAAGALCPLLGSTCPIWSCVISLI